MKMLFGIVQHWWVGVILLRCAVLKIYILYQSYITL